MVRVAIAIGTLASTVPALARIEPDQTIPDRPLVVGDGQLDLYGGLELTVETDPETDLADWVHVPIGASFGLGSELEVGVRVDTFWRPTFAVAFTPRVRYALGDLFAVGVAVTMPFGFISDRLGPRGFPMRLELPAFRYDGADAAVQAVLGWRFAFNEGPDSKALDASVAGILDIGSSAFALVDFGLVFPEFDDVQATGGLGLGWLITRRVILELEVFTPDFEAFDSFQVLVWLVHRWGLVDERASPDDWL